MIRILLISCILAASANVALAYTIGGSCPAVSDPFGPQDVKMSAYASGDPAAESAGWAFCTSSAYVTQWGVDNGVNSTSGGSKAAETTGNPGWTNGSGTSGIWGTGGKYRLTTGSTEGGSRVVASVFTGDYMIETVTVKLKVAGIVVATGSNFQYPEQLRNNDNLPHGTVNYTATLTYNYTGGPPDVVMEVKFKASGSWSGGANAPTSPTSHGVIAGSGGVCWVHAFTTPECKKPVKQP